MTSRTESPTFQQMPIPEDERAVVGDARKRIQEAAAECDDGLLEQYLAAGELTQEDLINGLRLGVHAGTMVPLSKISGSFRSSMRSSTCCHRRWTGRREHRWKACIQIQAKR